MKREKREEQREAQRERYTGKGTDPQYFRTRIRLWLRPADNSQLVEVWKFDCAANR